MKRAAALAGICAVFIVVAIVVTWPQARVLGTAAYPHQDVYFNMWRLEWFAHALAHSPRHLLDGNIFYPEPRTLTYSDAMPVEGFIAAPLVWAGVRPLLIQNLMIFGAMIASAWTMFVLVRYLTASRGAAIVAGIAFGFAPYRFEHVMHMELQWVMWSPLAFLFLHKTLASGRMRDGLLTGAMVALQMLSSIYYGVFLATLLALAGALLLLAERRVVTRRSIAALVAGAVLAVAICGAYAIPYLRTRNQVGERSAGQVMTFSARPSSYLISPPENWLYGGVLQTRARPEGRLFPGTLITLLAMIGLLLRPPSHRLIVYLMALVAAFELSLGFGGHVYGWFYAHVPVFRGLRAASRLGIFVLLFLAVIGGHGYAALTGTWGKRAQVVFVAVLCAVFVIEYRVDLPLSREYPNTAPAVYRLLARQPRGVVAEFPVPLLNQLPGSDPQYTYCSTFHWFPLVNGYSGMYPRSYLQRMLRLRGFPDEASFRQLQFDDVRYIILHDWPGRLAAIEGLAQSDRFVLLGTFDDAGTATAYLYRARE